MSSLRLIAYTRFRMKRVVSIAGAFLFGALFFGVVKAQDSPRPALSTTPAPLARFEVLQTNSSASLFTFRLDRYTGQIFQLSSCPQRSYVGNGPCWKEMYVLELPKPVGDSTPRYQIFIQGERGTRIFLINTSTGQSWQHGVDGADKWTPFLETVPLQQSFEVVK